jgi:hypothetical protein
MADLVTPMTLRVAATLGLADALAGGPRSTAELAAALTCDRNALDAVLGHLRTAGVLAGSAAGWTVTPLGEALADAHPSGLRRVLAIDGPLGRADLALAGLLTGVRGGGAAFEQRYGRGFWDDLAAEPARAAAYDAQMSADAARWAEAVVPAYPWGGSGHIADIGGGDGTLLAAILSANPEVRGTLVEQPGAASRARTRFAAADLAERATIVEGSFFDPLPAGADAYVLCAIIHDWPAAEAVGILRRCAEAAGAAGRVIVIEKTGPDGESPSTAMDVRMLAYFGGRERGVTAITALAGRGGLARLGVTFAGALAIIEFRAAP